jgi:hypothetical protein
MEVDGVVAMNAKKAVGLEEWQHFSDRTQVTQSSRTSSTDQGFISYRFQVIDIARVQKQTAGIGEVYEDEIRSLHGSHSSMGSKEAGNKR